MNEFLFAKHMLHFILLSGERRNPAVSFTMCLSKLKKKKADAGRNMPCPCGNKNKYKHWLMLTLINAGFCKNLIN